jgi:hypothetical protein
MTGIIPTTNLDVGTLLVGGRVRFGPLPDLELPPVDKFHPGVHAIALPALNNGTLGGYLEFRTGDPRFGI